MNEALHYPVVTSEFLVEVLSRWIRQRATQVDTLEFGELSLKLEIKNGVPSFMEVNLTEKVNKTALCQLVERS